MEGTINVVFLTIPDKSSMDNKIFFSMPDTDTVDVIEKTFCQRQVMNSIKNVGLSNTVITDETVNLG